MRQSLLSLLLLALMAACTPKASLSTYSLDHLYNEEAAVALEARRLDGGSYERIYLKLTFRSMAEGTTPEEIARRYQAGYQIGAGYDGNGLMAQDTLQLERMTLLSGRSYALTFNVNKPATTAVMMIRVEDRATGLPFVFDLPLPAGSPSNLGNDHYLVFNRAGSRPLYGSYAHPGDTVSLRSLTLVDKPIYMRQFVADFPPALPPMAVTTSVVSGVEAPKPVARYKLQPNTLLVLSSPGTYLIQEDTVADPGQALVVAPNKFPDLSRASELIAPLTYMTTRIERTKLLQAKNVKAEIDRFWLNITGNKEYARRLISGYYENVEYANAWFTDYREGWKTDRGMVFIIFGKPSQVLRSGQTEEWRYDERGVTPELRFIFERRAAPLGPQTWQLRRSPDYDRYWYAVVDQWRKGIIRR